MRTYMIDDKHFRHAGVTASSFVPSDDTVDLRVGALVYSSVAAAYLPEAVAVVCGCCGDHTDTLDGYEVPTPLGDVSVCRSCNRNPDLWDAAEVFFVGAMRGAKP